MQSSNCRKQSLKLRSQKNAKIEVVKVHLMMKFTSSRNSAEKESGDWWWPEELPKRPSFSRTF
ncbi:hypothetical protein HanPSC8_Chr16g0717751 [Helianthus annuus]|nr:hypothetical protein HanPSC8_Chr16g0717751 [Helianthus annuus]